MYLVNKNKILMMGGISINKYGGTTTVMSNLEAGTQFYVCNGAWYGAIVEKDGDKFVRVYYDRNKKDDYDDFVVDDRTLDIDILD